jgi:tRNA(Ile)-lysidine synthase
MLLTIYDKSGAKRADVAASDSSTQSKEVQGDKFIPFGMKGFKSVRNYLRDKKFSRFEKERQWVVCDGDRIVWLVNERVDNRFRVMPETRLVIKMKVKFV